MVASCLYDICVRLDDVLPHSRVFSRVATHLENLEKSGTLRMVRENLFLHVVYYREHCWSLVKNTVAIVVTVYMSIAVRNSMHFVLYRFCCKGLYFVSSHLKCLEKSGNLIVTGERPPWSSGITFTWSWK